jgi:puromycin-sensitive aminopeptidase
LWLNEGFATWVEYLAVEYCFPEWNVWNYYATDHLFRAFNLDGLKSSHPIEVPVGPPSEVFQIFDSISYCKGSAIIRMVNNFVGSDVFVKGLNQYLNKYKYKNASTCDLWDELDHVSNKKIKELMQMWTKEAGYPLVHVNRRIDENGHTILEFKQEKYLRISSVVDENLKWNVPISILTKSSHPNVHSTFLMTEKSMEVDIGVLNRSDWIKLNQNNVDFFRVKYSQQLFELILDGLDDPNQFASSMDRNQLLNDAFDLVYFSFFSHCFY